MRTINLPDVTWMTCPVWAWFSPISPSSDFTFGKKNLSGEGIEGELPCDELPHIFKFKYDSSWVPAALPDQFIGLCILLSNCCDISCSIRKGGFSIGSNVQTHFQWRESIFTTKRVYSRSIYLHYAQRNSGTPLYFPGTTFICVSVQYVVFGKWLVLTVVFYVFESMWNQS